MFCCLLFHAGIMVTVSHVIFEPVYLGKFGQMGVQFFFGIIDHLFLLVQSLGKFVLVLFFGF